MKDALEYIKAKHNGEIPYKYGSNECARLMEDYAKHYFEREIKKLNFSSCNEIFDQYSISCDCGSGKVNFHKDIGCKDCC